MDSSNNQDQESVEFPMNLKVGMPPRLGVAGLYEHEIDNLASGEAIPLYLNFSIFCLSLSGSLLGSIIPSIIIINYKDIKWQMWSLIILGIILLAVGIVLLVMWYNTSKRVKTLSDRIKTRIQ